MEKEKKTSGNPYYGFLVMLGLLLLMNTFIFPNLLKRQVIDTDYGTFISMVDSGKVKKVNIEENRILFSVADGEDAEKIYQTGPMNDPQLVDRLLEAKSPNENGQVMFTQIIPRENSPLLNFVSGFPFPQF